MIQTDDKHRKPHTLTLLRALALFHMTSKANQKNMGWMKMLQSSCDIHWKMASVAATVIRIGWSIGKRTEKSEKTISFFKEKRKKFTPLVNRSRSSNHSKGSPG